MLKIINFFIVFSFFLQFNPINAQDSSENHSRIVLFETTSNWHPFIDATIGTASVPSNLRGCCLDLFDKMGSLDAFLGFSSKKNFLNSNEVTKGTKLHLSLKIINNNLPFSDKNIDNIDIFSLGLGNTSVYGYKFSDNFSIDFTNQQEMNWNWLNNKFISSDSNVNHYLDYITDGVRFGNTVNNEIIFLFNNKYGISAGLSHNVIYQRHMFWYWLMSEAIYSVGDNIIDWFVIKISTQSIAATPFVHFLLHTAYNYGMYVLRKDNMNWPFDTAPGIMINKFNIGLSYTF